MLVGEAVLAAMESPFTTARDRPLDERLLAAPGAVDLERVRRPQAPRV